MTESLSSANATAMRDFDPARYRFDVSRTHNGRVRIDTYVDGQLTEWSTYAAGFDADGHIADEYAALAWLAGTEVL